ncbi:putative ribonuclease H-like domain-containing protein [Tanacetum coccineum]
MGLWYSKDYGFELIAYSDADHARCNDDCKSTSRGIQFLGDKLVSWSSKKKDCTAMSTAEAEYVSLSACCAQVIWMRRQLLDFGFRYNKKGKLAPRFVGPFEIIEKVGPVAYRLDLHEELNGVHDTFHVSNLKKCLVDPTLQVTLDEIRVYVKLNFVEEPVEILERDFKKLKRSRIAIIKVTVLASCQHSTLCVRKYCVSELSSCAGSELGSELTLLAGSELKTSELDTSELKTSEYRFLKIFILASYEQELWHHGIRGIEMEIFQGRYCPSRALPNALVVQDAHRFIQFIQAINWLRNPLEARIVVIKKNEAVYEEDIAFLKYDVKVRDNSITELKNRLVEALREKDDLKVKLEQFETSSKKLTDLLNSQINVNNKTGIGFDSQMTENELHNIHKNNSEVFESASDGNVNKIEEENNQVNDRIESTASKSSKDNLEQPKDVRPSAPIVKKWKSDSDDDCGNPQYALQDQGIFDSGCSRHMTGNKSYLTDYQDIDGGFVAFARSPKGGKITGKGKIRTGKLDFEDLLDESQVLLKVPRQNNMYSFNLKNVVPSGGLTCLFAKATIDESNLWHRRLGHVNFKTMNKLVRGNLVRGLPSKLFENDHTCVACQKGKQHKASCKTKLVSFISQPLQMLHMDLFGPTFVKSLNKKMYCLVVTDDFSRCDNGTEFKNSEMNQFCEMKGIKREFSVARTPQQNGVAERKNRTLIEAARTMLADSLLPTTFWAEAINTACYVQNSVLITKPSTRHLMSFITGITLDRIVKETLNIKFLENAPNVTGNGPDWVFDVDFLTISMNYVPVVTGNQTNGIAGTRDNIIAGQAKKKAEPKQEYILIPICTTDPLICQGPKDSEEDARVKSTEVDESEALNKDGKDEQDSRSDTIEPFFTNDDPSSPVNAAEASNAFEDHLFEQFSPFKNAFTLPNVPNVSPMNDNTRIFVGAYDDEDVGGQADLNNLETTTNFNSIPTTRINKDHPIELIIGDLHSALLTRRINKKDERGIVVRNKARLVAQGYTQEEGIDYDEVFAPVARIEAIRLFFAYASYMGFIMYQMDVKSTFLYGTIEEEVYVCKPPGFKDPHFPDKVYKVEKALYGLHQAPRAWYETLSTYLLENRFRRGTIDKTLFIKKDKSNILLVQVYVDASSLGLQRRLYKEDGIFISQDKYVAEILKKFDFVTVKTASTLIETNKALVKDEEAKAVDVHLYRSMIGSLMYLTAFRPDIIFDVCACARFQVTPKVSHLHAVKRIFRYLKGNPHQEVLWIQNQMLDYGFNLMNTKIYIDNESTICIVKNLVFHSKTKHIEIKHQFIRDSYEKKLIQVIKIHTNHNVADLLTKAFDVSRSIHLVADETVYKEWEDRMERAATTASSLEAEQDSGSSPRCQDTILGGAEAQSRFEVASKQSNDPPFSRVNTLGSGEDSMKLIELMEHCTTLSKLVSLKE